MVSAGMRMIAMVTCKTTAMEVALQTRKTVYPPVADNVTHVVFRGPIKTLILVRQSTIYSPRSLELMEGILCSSLNTEVNSTWMTRMTSTSSLTLYEFQVALFEIPNSMDTHRRRSCRVEGSLLGKKVY